MDEFTDALLELIEAKQDRDKSNADCEGSWGYYGHCQEERLANAKKVFAREFEKMVKKLRT